MKISNFALASVLLVPVAPGHAAESGSRTYPDPACSERTAKPENCVIQDGPTRQGTVGAKSVTPATPGPGPGTGDAAGKAFSGAASKSGGK